MPDGALRIETWPEEIRLVRRVALMSGEHAAGWETVSAGTALSSINRVARSDSWKVRAFARGAGILDGVPLSRVQDQQLLQEIRRSIERGDLVAVRRGRPVGKKTTGVGAERRRIARQLSEESRGRLVLDGRAYQVITGDAWTATATDRVFEVVAKDQAKNILGRLAVQPTAFVRLKTLLAQAAEHLSTDWRRPAHPDGLVLLRRRPALPPAPREEEPAMPARAKAPKEPPSFAIVDLTIPPVFAPGAEEIEIAYVFEDPAGVGDSARLELFASGDPEAVWTMAVPAAHLTDRRGSLKWDGKVDRRTKQLPDGYATLEASPYRLVLTANAPGREATAERQTGVVLAELQVALAPATCLEKNGPDWQVHRQIGVLPGDRSLNLDGNVFAMRLRTADGKYADELDELGLDLGWRSYLENWDLGAGPRIPIVATVRVRSSTGASVVAGKALGRAQILWDYVEPRMLPEGEISDRDRKYLDEVAAYDHDHRRPIGGGNVPAELGGKRDVGVYWRHRAVFTTPDDKVREFPFVVEPGRKRFWAATSVLDTDGPREGQSGVVFRPSIIAGDAYTVRAYLDLSCVLDDDVDIPDDVPSVKVGTFVMWREITLARRIRKCEEVPDTVPDPRPYLAPAFIALDDRLRANSDVMTKAEYDSAFQRAVRIVRAQRNRGNKPDLISLYALPDGASQYDRASGVIGRLADGAIETFGGTPAPTPWVATFRSWDDFVEAYAAGLGRSEDYALDLLLVNGIRPKNYQQKAENFALDIAVEMATPMARRKGITVLQFAGTHAPNIGESRWAGVAVLCDVDRHRSALVLFGNHPSVLAHEIGHCLFLPHAPSDPGEEIDGVVSQRHVASGTDCMMAYGRTHGFCAICLLRLRGCDGSSLKPRGIEIE